MPGARLIDEASAMPRWAQIAQILRQRVAEHGPGLTTMSDQSLAREFGVSPLTVRQAVQDLVRNGLVTRHRGKGTFVVAKPPQGSVDHLDAFMSEWRITGRDVRIDVLERSRQAASIPTAAMLQVKPGDLVAFLHRRRCADGDAVGVDYRYFPIELDERLDDADVQHETIWEVLENKLAMYNLHANVTIRATAAREEDARLLDIAPGSPVLDRGFQIVSATGRPILVGHSIYHPDRFIHATTVRRTSPSAV
jgi:GntR family transcriptional regulator